MKIKKLMFLLLLGMIATPLHAATKTKHSKTTEQSVTKQSTIPDANSKYIEEPDWLSINGAYFYDGEHDDLVTAGVGFTRLSSQAITTTFVNPKAPTLQELRRAKLARYIDMQTGEGLFFGFRKQELTPLFDGKIAGSEIQAYDYNDDVGMLLQIPIDFNRERPCIVAVPAIDSDGLYNAKDMQIRGLWGLRHDCAVVYNDKGLGNGIYDITTALGFSLDGEVAKDNLPFSPLMKNRDAFIKKFPHRYAIKQLHSKLNPEAKWGEYLLKSIEFSFYALNMQLGNNSEVKFNKDNTIVLVYGATDGGGAALKAGELDKNRVIDGIVAVNPQIQPAQSKQKVPLHIQYGNQPKTKLELKSIADYSSYAALYIPCAIPAIVRGNPDAFIPYADRYIFSQNRCNALKNTKLLTTNSPEEALKKLHDYGWTKEMESQLPYFYYHSSIALPYQYISEYGRYDVIENMCNYSVASVHPSRTFNQGEVEPLTKIRFEELWQVSKGSLPIWIGNDAAVLDLVNNSDANSPRRELFSTSKQSKLIDYNSDGVICLRNNLKTARVQKGIEEAAATANLNGIKTFIIHGKNNVKQLPNYTSRPYVALNSIKEGKNSQLRYIEVDNSSYLDSRIPFDNQLLSIDYYGDNAMDWLWSHLTKGTTLPESQVIHTKPRSGKAGAAATVTKENFSTIMQSPNRNNIIKKENGTIFMPNE